MAATEPEPSVIDPEPSFDHPRTPIRPRIRFIDRPRTPIPSRIRSIDRPPTLVPRRIRSTIAPYQRRYRSSRSLYNVASGYLESSTDDNPRDYTRVENFLNYLGDDDSEDFINTEVYWNGRPPAARSVAENLPFIVLTEGNPNTICAICKEEISSQEVAKQLPCLHHYHEDCILRWLRIRNTCPLCRYELPTDDAVNERSMTGWYELPTDDAVNEQRYELPTDDAVNEQRYELPTDDAVNERSMPGWYELPTDDAVNERSMTG